MMSEKIIVLKVIWWHFSLNRQLIVSRISWLDLHIDFKLDNEDTYYIVKIFQPEENDRIVKLICSTHKSTLEKKVKWDTTAT